MKVKRLKLLSSLLGLALVLALVMVAPPMASPAEAASMELSYDSGTPWGGSAQSYQGVRFSLPAGVESALITTVRFFYSDPGDVNIHITDGDHTTELTTPIPYSVASAGWWDVDVSGADVTVSEDFYVIIERLNTGNAAFDDDSNTGRSFWGSSLEDLTTLALGDLLIRVEISFTTLHVGPGQPYTTIQEAIDAADPGDTIIVHEGTYTENVNVNKSLTIQAAAGENVTVQAANSNDHVFKVTADYVNISGFTVTGATGMDKAGIYLGNGVDHCTITNNTAESNYSGIRLDSSNNNTIQGNTVSGGDGCGIWLSWQDSGNTISGNTVSDNWAGICLYRASENTISDNIASGNYFGIYLLESNGNILSVNTANENDDQGIRLIDSSDNTLSGNAVSGSACGIYLHESSNNTISGNTAEDNDYGVNLYFSSGNTISGNTASGNGDYGIYLQHSSDNTIDGNNTASGNGYGIVLDEFSANNTIAGNTLSDNDVYGIYLYYSSNNTIESNTASGNHEGIELDYSDNNTLTDNTCQNNDHCGILIYDSDSNTLSGNTASENLYGIRLDESSENTISGNTASENGFRGILLANLSNNNAISGNTASENGFHGIELSQSNGNTIEGNTANNNNNIGIYAQYSSGNTIEGNTANNNDNIGIYIHDSSGNTISGNTASENGEYGIYLFVSSDNTLLSNTVHDNGHGIYVVDSSGNLFVGNDISGNTAEEDSGVHLSGDVADNNILFNNIVNNTAAGSYGVYNEVTDIINATLNWWGDASGPSGVGPGTGDAVGGNVTFEPWLGASVVGVIAEDIIGAQTVVISGPTGSDTTLTVDTSGDLVTVIVALYSGNPHPEEPFPDKALGKYIDIYASDPDAINWTVRVEMSYTEDEVAAAGIDESTLVLYYWNASANEFQRCSDTGVDTATNIIWADVTEAEAGGLAGTPFTAGGAAPEAAPGGLSIGVIAGITVGAIAGAVLIFFAVRKWVWRS